MTLNANDKADIRKDFFSEECRCGNTKKNGPFCSKCYYALPKEYRNPLWRKFHKGYEEAQNEAAEWLEDAGL